ncbi:MAG: penicillin-binding protein 2 [Pseudomonadota bacterium]
MPDPLPPPLPHRSLKSNFISLGQALTTARRRMFVIAGVFGLCFLAVVLRLGDVALLQEGSELCLAARDRARDFQLGRGDLLDRHGQILATSILTSSLYATPKMVLDNQETVKKLRQVLPDINAARLLKRLKSAKGFVWLERHLTPRQQADVLRLGVPGVSFMPDQRRVYPLGALTSHVVGMVDIDDQGISGLEKGLNSRLQDNKGAVHTTLDLRLQHILHDEIQKGMQEFSARGGSAMVMDIRTGAVLAMVSLPDFDPNRRAPRNRQALFNCNTSGVYEMGSTMKVLTIAMALDSGRVTIDSKFDASKPIKIGRFTVTDYRGKNRVMDVAEIFMYSSNIGTAKLALKMGEQAHVGFLKKSGLFTQPAFEIPEVGAPIVPKKWPEIRRITVSYGYGLAVSPLQIICAISGVLRDDGAVPQPTLLLEKVGTQPVFPLVSPHTAKHMRALMRRMVEEGTGRKAKVPGIVVYGKSGTANARRARGRGYQKKDVNTAFVGVFPEVPRYAVYVRLDNPKGSKATFNFNAAGWNAAPVTGRIIQRIVTILGLEPDHVEQEKEGPLVKRWLAKQRLS